MPESASDPPSPRLTDDWPSTPGVQDLRNVVADVHHRLHQQRLIGDAEAIAYAIRLAKEAGVAGDERERLATQAFRRLFDDAEHCKHASLWQSWFRRRRGQFLEEARPVPPKELAPGCPASA
jgi:hypothetical protein